LKPAGGIYDFILREWLLLVAAAGFTLTSVYAGHLPAVSGAEIEILVLLLALFMVVKGWEGSSFLDYLAATLERGGQAALRLVIATFLLSMFVTNDAALVVMVPLALALDIRRQDLLVILLALAANAGSALTPVGNPQNLFIYWYYGIAPGRFMAAIAPFTVVFLVLLSLATLLVPAVRPAAVRRDRIKVDRTAYAYGILLVVVLLAVLRVLPAWSALMVVPYGLLFDRRSLRIDFALLLTLALFFGLADNLKSLFMSEMGRQEHVFLFSALASQVMSNVPAALIFSRFTDQWQALLWGVSVGGFGSLFGSVANLIAYKLYVSHVGMKKSVPFAARFLAAGYAAFFIGAGLYFIVRP